MENFMIKKFIFILILLITYSTQLFALDFTITSPAFDSNTMIPPLYTCNDANQAPELNWQNPPEGTKSYVLIMEDPDAADGTWIHWLVFNIPAMTSQLAKGQPLPAGAINGKNSWGVNSYGGPCPPTGTHHYVFQLYALNSTINLSESANAEQVLAVMKPYIIGQCQLVGLYASRK